jgi:uncharacterized protein
VPNGGITMQTYTKPLPVLSDENREFWQAARNGALRMQKCDNCSHIRYPISQTCPHCLSNAATWHTLSGYGEVFSFIVFHQVYNKEFAGDVPYNVALIQLDEGPRMFSNVVGTPNHRVKMGDRVQVVFDPATEEISIPRFRRVEAE